MTEQVHHTVGITVLIRIRSSKAWKTIKPDGMLVTGRDLVTLAASGSSFAYVTVTTSRKQKIAPLRSLHILRTKGTGNWALFLINIGVGKIARLGS